MYDSQTEEKNYDTIIMQKLSEMWYWNFYVTRLREKWVSVYNVN